jgi:hypothetical protein
MLLRPLDAMGYVDMSGVGYFARQTRGGGLLEGKVMNQCPKCGSENTLLFGTLAENNNQDSLVDRCMCCGARWTQWQQEEIQKQAEEIERLKADLEIERLAIYNVITTIGGTDYEGNPTSRVNFLQRLRQLLEFEAAIPKLEDLISIRCLKHRNVPAYNHNENGIGECGACIAEELSRLKQGLKWQSGKPPEDGWYWSRIKMLPQLPWKEPEICYFHVVWRDQIQGFWDNREWSGPLQPPEEEK